MSKRWSAIVAISVLVLLPVIVQILWWELTALPRVVKVGTGSEGGLFRTLSDALADQIERNLSRVEVRRVETDGSMENLLWLKAGTLDFDLYQPDTMETSGESPLDETTDVAFVANLYFQPVHFIVQRDAQIESGGDLPGKRNGIGLKDSGDYAMSMMLMEYFGLDRDSIVGEQLDYPKLVRAFDDGSLDAAFITVGVRAEVLGELLGYRKV